MSVATGYNKSQILLHWTVAVFIAFQFLASEGIEQAWDAFEDTGVVGDAFSSLALAHIVVGVAVLLLMAARLWLRLKYGAPPADPAEPVALQWLAKLAHVALYALLIILPVSGLVGWILGNGSAIDAHKIAKTVLLPLIGLHVLGALVHQFFWKTNVLRRMLVPSA
ncbi:MAG: cytochrome b/b6 domain-containing protein [Rhizobiaceae bacterium]|nr:cytochrome b/b6 domain-containing protein [Rhizobiaceae bacterium]